MQPFVNFCALGHRPPSEPELPPEPPSKAIDLWRDFRFAWRIGYSWKEAIDYALWQRDVRKAGR